MILSYLYSLGFSVIITGNASQYCGDFERGCYIPATKQIVTTSVNNFWHEVGHALVNNDLVLQNLIKENYPELYKSYQEDYTRYPEHAINELTADLYKLFVTVKGESFKESYPKIYNHFILYYVL